MDKGFIFYLLLEWGLVYMSTRLAVLDQSSNYEVFATASAIHAECDAGSIPEDGTGTNFM